MGFRLVLKSVTLNDLERSNDRRRALSLRQLSFFIIVTSIFAVFISVAIYTQRTTSMYSTTVVIIVKL